MNKFDKDLRNIIILVIIFLLLFGIYLICELLKSDKEESIVEVDGDYKIVNQINHFKLYELNEELLEGFNITLENIHMLYINNELMIDDIYIHNDVSIVNKIGLYDNLLVMLLYDNSKSYVLIYDKSNNNPKLIDQVDNMELFNIEGVELSEAGFDVYITNVNDNYITIDNDSYNVCEYKENIDVIKHIYYSYNSEDLLFNNYDLLEKTSIKEYKKNIC